MRIAKRCICADWQQNVPKLNRVYTTAARHGALYTGESFTWCPWCERMLKTDDEIQVEQEQAMQGIKCDQCGAFDNSNHTLTLKGYSSPTGDIPLMSHLMEKHFCTAACFETYMRAQLGVLPLFAEPDA